MRLSARILGEFSTVNSFDYNAAGAEFMAGDATEIFFQLVDVEQHSQDNGFSPAGLRYVPDTGATLLVSVLNLDSSKQFSRIATQPFLSGRIDPSIWKFSLLATDPVKGTSSLKLTLTEGTVVHTALLKNILLASGTMDNC